MDKFTICLPDDVDACDASVDIVLSCTNTVTVEGSVWFYWNVLWVYVINSIVKGIPKVQFVWLLIIYNAIYIQLDKKLSNVFAIHSVSCQLIGQKSKPIFCHLKYLIEGIVALIRVDSISFLHKVIVLKPVCPTFKQRIAIHMHMCTHDRQMMVTETSKTTNFWVHFFYNMFLY